MTTKPDLGSLDAGLNYIDPLDVPIWGAEAIGRALGKSKDSVFYLYSHGKLDGIVRKVGGRYATTPRALARIWE